MVARNPEESHKPCGCGCKRLAPTGPQGQPAHHSRKGKRYKEIDRGYKTPCYVWLLARTWNGYGLERSSAGPMTYAHRLAYERAKGPIPEGMQIDHLYQVRECVNPEHLEAVTQVENLRRGRGTKLTVEDARAIKSSSEPAKELALRFGISISHVSDIRSGRAWADVEVNPRTWTLCMQAVAQTPA
jgi:hypothetical protein